MTHLNFYLSPTESLDDDALVIKITGKPTSAQEKEILEQLKKEERNFQTKTTGQKPLDNKLSAEKFHILPKNTTGILMKIAATGNLKLGSQSIVCDFYSKNRLTFLVDQDAVIGQIQTRSKLIDLADSPFIGRGEPHCFVEGITLKFLASHLRWKVLKKTYTQDPPPTISEIKACVIEGDCDTPQIEYDTRTQKEDPLPILKLKDQTGAFAEFLQGQKQWENDLLETGFKKRQSEYFCPLDQVNESLTLLLEMGWKILSHQNKIVLLPGKLKLHAEDSIDSVLIKGSQSFGEHQIDLAALTKGYQTPYPLISLNQNCVGLLPKSFEIQSLVSEGEWVAEGIRIRRPQTMSFESILKSSIPSLFHPPKEIALNSQFHGTLRPYQQEGVNWLAFLSKNRFHGILADDMGLGKTVQVLAYLSTIQQSHPSLIAAPASLLYNWKKEAETFFPSLQATIHHGSERSKTELPSTGLILTSYGTLLRDLNLFKNNSFQCLFLDEAQTIKNRTTQQFQAVCEIKANFRCCITGTPIENRASELLSHFHFLMPDLLKKCEPQDAAAIKQKTRPFILRRTKDQVADDLPEKMEQNIWISMPEEQKKAYNRFLSGVQQNLLKKVQLDGAGKHRMEILETLLRLRQICCHPQLVNGMQTDQSGKLDALINDMQTIREEGKKALIFSQFTSMLTLIKNRCLQNDWSFCYLDGQTKNRGEVVNRFQNNPELPFFLISLKAGGVGLNLTAADYVLLFDPWWNPAIEQQAIDRAHRIGRKEAVIAKRYLCINSVEEKMHQLNCQKKETRRKYS